MTVEPIDTSTLGPIKIEHPTRSDLPEREIEIAARHLCVAGNMLPPDGEFARRYWHCYRDDAVALLRALGL